MHQTHEQTVNLMITNTLSSSLNISTNCKKNKKTKRKHYNNLVEDKYLQRPSHFKQFSIESTVSELFITPRTEILLQNTEPSITWALNRLCHVHTNALLFL